MGRKETNAKFIAGIDGLNKAVLRVACYVNYGNLAPLEDMEEVVNKLKNRFADNEDDWCVYSTANEYERIKDYSPSNLQLWSKYRRNANADQPIAKSNGSFIEVKADGIRVTIDGSTVFINDADYISIDAHSSDGEDTWANVSYAAMQKIIQIKEHWIEIKRLVE